MKEYCVEYNNFKDLMKDEPKLAKELLEEKGKGTWQNNSICKFECVEDFACYERDYGCYTDKTQDYGCCTNTPLDFDGVPNPLDYVDLTRLGNALVDNWNETFYFLASDGAILSTEYGW